MRNETNDTQATRQYAAAYAAQYTSHDLPLALRLYRRVLASHANEPEAGFCRMQLQNIINAVVPKQELLDAQMELVLAHFQRDGTADA